MKLLLNILFFILLSAFFSVNVKAKESLTIVAGFNKPPYVIKTEDTISGFEVDLIDMVLEQMGYHSNLILVPFGRSMKLLDEPGIDGILTASPKLFTDPSKLTKPYVVYQNAAISLKKSNIQVDNILQLQAYSMASFQMASKLLGNEFATATEISPYFVEVTQQERQLKLLAKEKVQLLIMDVNIFNHFNKNTNLEVKTHPIFPKSAYVMAFANSEIVEPFNQAMQAFKASNAYRELLIKHGVPPPQI